MNARQRLGIPMAVVARWGRWKVLVMLSTGCSGGGMAPPVTLAEQVTDAGGKSDTADDSARDVLDGATYEAEAEASSTTPDAGTEESAPLPAVASTCRVYFGGKGAFRDWTSCDGVAHDYALNGWYGTVDAGGTLHCPADTAWRGTVACGPRTASDCFVNFDANATDNPYAPATQVQGNCVP